MRKTIQQIATAALCLAVMFCCTVVPAFAATAIPDGVLIVDQDGFTPDASSGTYYLQVSDMMPGETYTKNIHIQNLNVNDVFHIYMKAKPVKSEGDIALFNEVTLTLSLDGTQIYSGSPDGLGNVDMQTDSVDLGDYSMGQQRLLVCSVTLNQNVTGKDDGTSYGSVDFEWAFNAVRNETNTNGPKTGDVVRNSLLVFTGSAAVAVVMFFITKKRKSETEAGK